MQHFDPAYSAARLASLVSKPDLDDYLVALRSYLGTLRRQICDRARMIPSLEDSAVSQAFTFHAVEAWWEAKCGFSIAMPAVRTPPSSGSEVTLDPFTEDLLETFGRHVEFCPAPEAAYQFGLLYTALLPKSVKQKHSLYYTPPGLAAQLVQMAREDGADFTRDSILEPSCGGGVLLTSILLEMAAPLTDSMAGSFLKEVSERVSGFEKDPFGAWLAQVMVDGTLFNLALLAGMDLPEIVECRDTLEVDGTQKFDLVIGNPPFGKITKSAVPPARFKRSIHGHPNIYGLFFDQATQMVSETGRVCFITPTGFLSGAYFKNLRALLRSDVTPSRISFPDRRRGIFAGANQTVALSCFHKNAVTDILVQHLALEPSGRFTSEPLGRIPLPPSLHDPWILPRSAYQARIAPRLPHLSSRLSDWGYSAHTGPVIWNRFKESLSREPMPGSVPLIWAEAITYEGTFKWAAERKDNMRWFKLKPDEAHLQCSEPCILVQRTTSPDQDRRLMTATLPEAFLDEHGAVVVENHVNMIRPKQPDAKVPLSTLAAFLGSVAAEEAFRCVSGSNAVSVAELEALPLPRPEALSYLTELVDANASYQEIGDECWRLFLE